MPVATTSKDSRGEDGPPSQNGHQGLSNEEAAARLAREGPNEIPSAGRRRLPRILRDVLSEPMFGLLLGSGVIYLLLGDKVEAALLLVFASMSSAIAVIQEARSERVLDALRNLTSPRALVIREGERRRIPGREDDRINHGDHPAGRRGKAQISKAPHDALDHCLVRQVAARIRGHRYSPACIDDEPDRDAPLQVGVGAQAVLVTKPKSAEVLADDTLDDLRR